MKQGIKKMTNNLMKCKSSSRHEWLESDLDSYEPMLDLRINNAKGQGEQWAIQAKKLVEKARSNLEGCKIDEGWKAYNAAKRMEVFGMGEPERIAVANTLLKEVTKMNEWRGSAIMALCGKSKGDVKESPTPESLIKALELRDEHFNNLYYKTKLTWKLIRLLFILLFLIITGICLYFLFFGSKLGKDSTTELSLVGYILGVLLFGFLGAVTSAILFTRNIAKSARITELGSSQEVTISKIFVGAAFSVFIFMLLRSSIADNIQLFSFAIDDPLDYFCVAFVSGFSERLAQKAIEAVAGNDKEDEKTTPPPAEG
jgi:hypothetical protein